MEYCVRMGSHWFVICQPDKYITNIGLALTVKLSRGLGVKQRVQQRLKRITGVLTNAKTMAKA